MRNRIITLISALSLCAASLQAQNVQKVWVGDNQNFGITYKLPQTAVCVTVKATVTKTEAGVYGPYAEKYLGLKDVAASDQTIWEPISITLDGVAVADSSKVYHIIFSDKGALPTFYLSDEGALLSINREPEKKAQVDAEPQQEVAQAKKSVLKASDVMSEEILKAGSKAKQAELTAREIFSIRESRRNLLKGDVDNMPADGASFQLVLDNLDAQEQALLSLFIGESKVTTVERSFEIVPTENVKDEVIFRFSRHYGFVDKDDLVGEPYYITVDVKEDNRMKTSQVVDPKKKPMVQGIAYTVPGKAHVKLSFDGEILAETDMLMGQLGHVEQLPVTQFTDKKKVTTASFSPLTGSIKIYE